MSDADADPAPDTPQPRPRWRRLRRVALIVAGVLLLLLIVVWALLDSIATAVARSQMASRLQPEHALAGIALSPLAGHAAVTGLRIEQPEGVVAPPLLALERVAVDLVPTSLLGDRIEIHELRVEQLSIHLVRDAQGRFTLESLLDPALFADDEAEVVSESPPPPEAAGAGASLAIERLRIDGLSLHLEDRELARSWRVDLRDLALELDGLVVGPDGLALERTLLRLASLELAQSPRFGSDDLLALAGIELALGPLPTAGETLVVERVGVDDLGAYLVTTADGDNNVAATVGYALRYLADLLERVPPSFGAEPVHLLTEAPAPAPDARAETEAEAVANEAEQANTERRGLLPDFDLGIRIDLELPTFEELPAITFERVVLANGHLILLDRSMTDGLLPLMVQGLRVDLQDLACFPADPVTAGMASGVIDFRVAQPRPFPPMRSTTMARIAPIGREIPTVALRSRSTGLALDTLGDLISLNLRRTIGAYSLDVGVELSLDPERIELLGVVATDRDIHYDFSVIGPPQQPDVQAGKLLFEVAGRIGGGLRNLGGNALAAGGELLEGGWAATKAVGGGVVDVGSNLGHGLLGVVQGAVTLDVHAISAGASEATVGSVSSAGGAAMDTGGAVTGSVGGSLGSFGGDEAQRAFLEGAAERHQAAVEAAAADLYPEYSASDEP